MGAITRALPTLTIVSLLALSGCGYSGGGAEVSVAPTTKSITVSGTVRDGTGGGSGSGKLANDGTQKPKAIPAEGCGLDSFVVRVGTNEVCSVPLGGGIHEYEITADVASGLKKVVVNFRRRGFPPSSQSVNLSGTGSTVAATFQPRVYDKTEEVDETATVTIEANNASDGDDTVDATIEIEPGTTDDNVTISILVVDPADASDRELLPGEQINAEEQELEQFTAVEITLSDEGGEEVQPADGKPISVTLNLPPAAVIGIRQLIAERGSADNLQVDWRSYNEDKEIWQQEDADPGRSGIQGATVIFDGDDPVSMRAFVSHLTWYAAGDVIQPSEQGCLAVAVKDNAGNPVDDVVVKLQGEGEAFGDKGITDSSGLTVLDSLISTDTTTRTVTISVVRNGSTVARLTGQAAPTTGGVSTAQPDDCDLGPTVTINVEGTVNGTVVRGFQRNAAANAAVFIESTDDGIDGLARTRTGTGGAFTFTVPTPFNFEVFAGNDSRTGTIATAAVSANAGELYLGNTAPNGVSIQSPSTLTVPTGSISLTGVGSDVDGDTVSYVWTATQGSLSSSTGKNVSWTAPDSPSGSASISVSVSDGELATQATITLSWDEVNVAPTIDQISSSNAGNVPNGGTATITAVATDANSEDTITYSWSTSAGSITTGSESAVFTAPGSGFASATITLQISDGEFTDSDTFTQGFGTPPNQPPTITNTSRAPDGNVSRGTAVDVSVSASDPDSSPSALTISWTAASGSFNGPTNGSTAQWIAPNTVGSFEIVVTVSDGEASDSETLVVVVENTAPVITSVTSSPAGTVGKSAVVALSSVAADPDGDAITYQWTADTGSFNGSTNQATAEWVAPDAGGTANITLTVSDGLLSDSESISLTVSSNGPVINSLTADPSGDVQRGTTVALTSDVTDPDGDSITYQWSANIGSFTGSTTDPAASWVAPDASGNAVITLTVSDGEFTSADTVEFAVLNHQPVINSATADPSGTVAKSAIIALISDVTDNDGDATLTWSADSGSFNGATDQATAEWVAPATPGVSTITLTVTDGEFTSSADIEITVGNAAPVINSATSTPADNVPKGSLVDLSVDATDADGDSITYLWTANVGSFTGAVDAATAEWQAPDGNASATITIEVSDGIETVSQDIPLSVFNSAPVIESLTRTPSGDVAKGQSVSLESDVADADGDPITYSWTSAGDGSFDGATNGPTATWNAPAAPGDYQLTLEVSDGTETVTDTLDVTVANVAPSAVDDIASTNVDESVLISVLANDSDDDGDPITLEAITTPASNGTATISGDQVEYQPASGFIGTDTFSYSISDGFETATADVAVTVTEVQAAAFGDFNALFWASAFESDGRFNSKRLAYYSGLYSVSMLDNGGGDVDFSVVGSNAEYDIELNTFFGGSSVFGTSEQEADLDLEELQASTENGAVYVYIPFEEQDEPSGDYVEVGLPEVVRLLPAGDDNYIGTDFFQGLATTRPVVSDLGYAVNTEQELNEYFEPALQLYTRRSESFDVASLTGEYGLITHVISLDPNGEKGVESQVEVVSLDGGSGSSTSVLIAGTSGSSAGFETSNFAEGFDSGESREYSLEAPVGDLSGRIQGTAQVHFVGSSDPALALDGYADPSGTLFTIITASELDGGSDTEEVHQALTRGVRLGSGIVDADLIGKTYNLTISSVDLYEGSDSYDTETISSVRMRFDAGGELSFFCGSESLIFEAGRDDDLSAPYGETGDDADSGGGECFVDGDSNNLTTGTWILDSDRGELTLTQTETNPESTPFLIDMRGFISENLDHIVVAEYENNLDEGLFLSSIVIGSLAGEELFDNVAPELSVNAGVTSSIKLSHGESIALEATVSDADGDMVSVEWYAAGAGSFSAETGVNTVFTAPSHGHGSTQIFAAANDGKLVVGVSMSVEFGPGYAAGASAEQHSAAAEDIEDNLQDPEDVRGFFAGFNPWTETGSCLPYDSNDDTNETTGTQTRTHVDSVGADATGMDFQVGDVIQLTYDDCLEDDDFDDAYSNGTVTFTIIEVPASGGDEVQTHAWTTEWDFENRELDGDDTETEIITGNYTVTQSSEEEDGQVEFLTTRVEMLSGQELRVSYDQIADGGGSYDFDQGVLYLSEGTVWELEESEFDWSFTYDVFFTELDPTETVTRTDVNFFTVAPLVGRILQGGLENETEYSLPSAGIARSEFSAHPTIDFDGTRVVVLDVQYNDPFAFSFPESDMLIYLIEDWDGTSTEFEQVAETSYAIIDDFANAPEGEAYALLPPSFDGQKYRIVDVTRSFIVSSDIVSIASGVAIVDLGFDINATDADVHFGLETETDLILDSFGGGSFSTFERNESELEDDRDTLPIENGHIFASFEGSFTDEDSCTPENETLLSAGNNGLYISVFREQCTAYQGFSGNSFDAALVDDVYADAGLAFFVPGEADLSDGDLAGDYGMVTFGATFATGGGSYSNNFTLVKNVSLDSNGEYLDESAATGNLWLIERDEDVSGFVVASESPLDAGVVELEIDSEPNGNVVASFAFEGDGSGGEASGAASVSNGLIALNGAIDGEGSDRGVIQHVLLKRAATPTLNNTEWLVHSVVAEYGYDDATNEWFYSSIYNDDATRLVIDGSGNVTWTGKDNGAQIDIAEPNGDAFIDSFEESDFDVSGVVDASPAAGDVSITVTEGDLEYVHEGYQSVDGQLMVMRGRGDGVELGEGIVSTGLFVMVRNDGGAQPNAVPTAGTISDPGPVTSGASVEVSVAGFVDPEGQPLTYSWQASIGSLSTDTDASSADENGLQRIDNAGTTVTFHADGLATAGRTAVVRAVAFDGVRYSSVEVEIVIQ